MLSSKSHSLTWLVPVCALFVGWGPAALVSAQVPDETQLPGQRNHSAAEVDSSESGKRVALETDPLTDERVLPGSIRIRSGASGPQKGPVPSELVLQRPETSGMANPLPKDKGTNAPADAADDNPVDNPIDTPGDQRPILRLNYPGHSARINVLRFSEDGRQLLTAGQDKDIHAWQRDPGDANRWGHERTIRWQVWRGPRGTVNDIDVRKNEIAIAGYGAMGGTGEIWIANAGSGKQLRSLYDYDEAHRSTVDSLRWSKRSSPRLVSADLMGRVAQWSPDKVTGKWTHRIIVDEDVKVYGDSLAKAVKPFRRFHPCAFWGEEIVTLHLERMQTKRARDGTFSVPIWKLQLNGVSDDQAAKRLNGEIAGLVPQFEVSPDETTLAAACYSDRTVRLWRRKVGQSELKSETIRIEGVPLFIDFDSSSRRLLVGTEAKDSQAFVALYDLTNQPARKIDSIELPATAIAGRFDPSGNAIALAIGNEVRIHRFKQDGTINVTAGQTLRTPAQPITRIAASRKATPVRVAISRTRDADGQKPLEQVFDLSRVTLEAVPVEKIDSSEFLDGQRLEEKVTIRSARGEFNAYDLYFGETALGRLPFQVELHGRPTTVSTAVIDGKPYAIVGTAGQNNVYVFSVDPPLKADAAKGASKTLEVVRQFRGHSSAVRSTSVTADGRYLLTASDDATVCIWNLDTNMVANSINRWGASFEIVDQKLTVASIDKAGPLYFRGVRSGDEFASLKWPNAEGEIENAQSAEAMLKALTQTSFDTQVVFNLDRQGQPIATFQMFPAWYPLATLLVDDQREWALWTPAGIYNASLEGNQRFGWQVNRGLDQDVDFFRADQFRAALERPEVMRRLLTTGSLAAAMAPILGGAPPSGESAIVNQIQSRPQIRIVSPATDPSGKPTELNSSPTFEVVAQIETPNSVGIGAIKALVDGVPGALQSQRMLSPTTTEARWRFQLPRQDTMQLEVLAATDSQSVSRETLVLHRSEPAKPSEESKTRMHLLAMGISKYSDPNITSLDFAARATSAISDSLRSHAGSLYQVETTQLVDSQATRSLWRICAATTFEDLKDQVGPDDLIIMYLCGHGMRDRRTGQWYFVSADANYRDLMNDEFDDCLSLSDLSVFAKLPCRKLAILDSCHSGAVQELMREDDLKAAIRVLQDDVVITMTASEGREEAAEVVEAGLGRFTSRLLEAFAGKADANGDGQVSLRETVDYVSRTVVADSQQDGMAQHPTAGPRDLINRLHLPLTQPLKR